MAKEPIHRREMERAYERVSPFELKNRLIELANSGEEKSARAMLDAGRGNPNWIAATPRESFFALGYFALQECRRTWNERDLAGKPAAEGIAERFFAFARGAGRSLPGMDLLLRVVEWAIERKGFRPDAWVHELVDGIVGDNYPMPDRMLTHAEQVVRDYLVQELFGNAPAVPLQLFAVEGATAAMCYLFETLRANHLLNPGDQVAMMVPIFPPYVEIPQLPQYDFDVVWIHASGRAKDGSHTWQYPREELDKLKDPRIRALFLVNPSNPPSVALAPEALEYLVQTVRIHHPDLMIVTDDVYSTFTEHFRSLLSALPYNTVGVYSYSKYFGVTGWRLGVIAAAEDNVFDEHLRQLPEAVKQHLNRRYASLTMDPEQLRFMDRLVADSRQVALNHTAGLSTPQQVQMTLFSAFALLDEQNRYKQQTRDICIRRLKRLYDGLGLPVPEVPYSAHYYTEFDLGEWARLHYGDAFTAYLKANYEPVDVLFRLAEQASIVLLNGGGFYGPAWSVRVSLANLDDDAYGEIGKALHRTLERYVAEWRNATDG
ncbi:aspartate 4-decarboxylase [Alicyclobacillus contaminans]|uniref:aspartate 4-decarboxylase n=1 Tax=Alicyclobacillus contaminans TaxID=392016 RepID=UPI000405C76E|nr:aspartate 4-decarboxylase [Alicyclobacillus contaminans]